MALECVSLLFPTYLKHAHLSKCSISLCRSGMFFWKMLYKKAAESHMHCSNVEKVLHQRIFQQVPFWAPGFLRDPFLPSLLDLKFITLRTEYSSVTWSHKFDICFNTLPLMKKYQNYNPLCSAPFRGWANNNSFLAG